jgi:broad specificity phosphatase PhoE
MTTIHLIRHAKAKNRLEWTEPDDLRPLTKRGRREARALAERLASEELARLVSSPYVRCAQTLEPLAAAADLSIETTEALAEGADGTDAVELLLALASEGPAACCTHGDVLSDVLGIVAGAGVHLGGPQDAPVASTWVFEVEDGRFAGARFVEQPPR